MFKEHQPLVGKNISLCCCRPLSPLHYFIVQSSHSVYIHLVSCIMIFVHGKLSPQCIRESTLWTSRSWLVVRTGPVFNGTGNARLLIINQCLMPLTEYMTRHTHHGKCFPVCVYDETYLS